MLTPIGGAVTPENLEGVNRAAVGPNGRILFAILGWEQAGVQPSWFAGSCQHLHALEGIILLAMKTPMPHVSSAFASTAVRFEGESTSHATYGHLVRIFICLWAKALALLL